MAQVLMIVASILAMVAGILGGGAGGGAFPAGNAPQVAFAAGPVAPPPMGLQGTTIPANQNLGQTLQASFVPPQTGGATGPGGLNPDPGTPGQVITEGPASHYLGPDDNRPTNPLTGGKVEQAAQSGYMVDGSMPTAAMKNVPLGTKVRVTNMDNGASIIVRINDRGPYVGNRVIDLTYGAFSKIANPSQGVISRVRVEALPPETPTSYPERLLTASDWSQISGSVRAA